MSEKVEQLIGKIKELTVLELSTLVKSLEEEFGVSAAMAVASAPVSGDSSGNDSAEATKTEFDVILKNSGANKIKIIKLVKDLVGLGLKESKEIVDNPPKTLKEKITKEAAEEIKKQFEELGAEIEIK
ncbi:MAG: 50S ribosomal protein L7/L12 [Candidatus Improbicoccus pseudotrichonymphae]|uniref:Large ribosomal subunit protein bL12 n=1 Tax=Candidatus Improbicoccus pseudotrichonymphae TaxID=3033792 RepID=A0AA48I4W4_9FIRM|nr:MAG: 50S ribosomal protein L7/L12 [Candidatus Improbicoccus pseudotrichonymphae]